MAGSLNTAYDQLSGALAEGFLDYADDSTFKSNAILARGWEEAVQVDPSRFLAADIISGDNANAGVFGPYDTILQDPQSIISTAAFQWSWYTCSVQLDYQTLRSVQGRNQRLNIVATQLQTGLASVAKNMDIDLGNYAPSAGTKGRNLGTGFNALSVIEASDDGTLDVTYGAISRTGAGSLATWQGQVLKTLTSGNIGTSTNDPAWKWYAQAYNNCSIGQEAPTDVFTVKQGISSYMYVQAANQRVSPGDTMQIGFGGAMLFDALMSADDYMFYPTQSTSNGANYYLINMGHTHFFYFGKKGFDFIDWIDSQQVVSKIARYVTMMQFASTEPRLNGQLLNINWLTNL